MNPHHRAATAFISIVLCTAIAVRATPRSEIVGDVRIQSLAPTLLRIEAKGPKGFEDRETFHVVSRDWPGAALKQSADGDEIVLRADRFAVRLPREARSLDN